MKSILAVTLTSFLTAVAGCGPQSDMPQPAAQAVRQEPVGPLKRGMDLRKVENDLVQLGLFHQHYWSEFGKAPASLKAFEDYIRRDMPTLVKSLDEEMYVYVPNCPAKEDRVLAYEAQADLNGRRRVVFGDGHVVPLTGPELDAALKSSPQR
jgi:hypothetical protein